MRDVDARGALKAYLVAEHVGFGPTRVIDELGVLQGSIRADVVVVNGSLHAFEIKSERDTLRRLPAQAAAYNRIFDLVTIVTASNHLKAVWDVVPSWWGVLEARASGPGLKIVALRPANDNPTIDALSLAQLLWRDEVLDTMKDLGISRGMSRCRRQELWSELVETVPLSDLRRLVRDRLRAREDWRSDEQRN